MTLIADPWAELANVTASLAAAHRELGELAAAERHGRITAYFHSDDTSVSGRDRYADFQVLELSTDIIKLKAEIAALTVERDHLLAIVEAE